MKCPYCSYTESKVLDSRETPNLESTRRRRECLGCSKRFTTYERIERLGLTVIKKDGSLEPFDREKLKKGILVACEKRPVSTEKIDDILNNIEAEVRKKKDSEIKSKSIGNLVMKNLLETDHVAYMRFTSVYRGFKSIDSFKKELTKLETK